MKTNYLKATCTGALLCASMSINTQAQESRPNIIVILADDLGYGDVGYQGCTDFRTPNIDSIARKGVSFSAAYVTAPVCAPSRAGFLTGRYQNRFGFEDNPGPFTRSENTLIGTPLDEKNIAERLKVSGYYTGLIGKWHDGSDPRLAPTNRGFDEFFGFITGYVPYNIGNNKAKLLKRGKYNVSSEDNYLTDAFGTEAVSFIDRNHDKQFFLYLAFNAVHYPLTATEKYLNEVSGIQDPRRRTLAAMACALDYNIGRVLEALEKNNLTKNTIIVFFSDNGGSREQNASLNTPLRGEKLQLFEGGIRIPLCIAWPERLPAGKRIDDPIISLDLVPTLLAAAGQAQLPSWNLDGVDLLPFMSGGKKPPPHDILHWRFNEKWAVQREGWKLLHEESDQGLMLFNLSKDISEKNDVASEHPDIVRDLKRIHEEWDATLKPKQWGWGGADLTRRNLPEFDPIETE